MENHVLIPSLECAVPLHVLQIKKLDYLPAIPDGIQELIASHGDTLLFADKREKKGAAAEIFNKLALTIAILSFSPGGIRVFNNYWKSEL
jgi:hypothetical protein